MKLRILCLFLLLACMYPSLAQGSYEDCCLKYGKEPKLRIKQKVINYRIQKTDGGCNKHAVVFAFELKKLKRLCADPDKPWVQKLMKATNEILVAN